MTKPDLLRASTEGKEAAQKGLHFKTGCPYTFDKFHGMSQAEFNKTQRPLMNAWFDSWKANYKKAVHDYPL